MNGHNLHRLKTITMFAMVIAVFAVFASCGQRDKEGKQEAAIDIVKLMEEADQYEETGYDSVDNKSYFADYEKFIIYLKGGSTKLADDIPSFLDSIGKLTGGIPVSLPDEPDNEIEIVEKAIRELERYQKGERHYYPETEVKEALGRMSHGIWKISTHGTDACFDGGLYYWFNFATQAALLCPNLEFISKVHSLDSQVGLYGIGTSEDKYAPVLTCMITPKDLST